ncbi:hypothetical protein [Streptobacillus moniliformis]|uniref:hypothetical protein n=1 Tax=Streptobacillus moniliformis TaxID=34105 RepID=UPI0007E469A0|nr:hypothetical protein [Streptobacillus moniliformis]
MYKIRFQNKEYNEKLAGVQFIKGEGQAELSDYDVAWFKSLGAIVEKIEEAIEEVTEFKDEVTTKKSNSKNKG